MNLFKKLTIAVILIHLSIASYAQQKKSTNQKRAKLQSDYVAEKMNLNDDQKSFLYETFLEKFKLNTSQIKDKNLSQEDKKVIYKATNKTITQKLSTKFNSDQIKEIRKYQQEINKAKAH